MIATETASLAISIASGVVKLGKRLDEVLAEEAAVSSELAVLTPTLAIPESIRALKAPVEALLEETDGIAPDPLGPGERAALRELLAAKLARRPTLRSELRAAWSRHHLGELTATTLDLDSEIAAVLRARNPQWNLEDPDVGRMLFFVSAGRDDRTSSLAFRIGATVVDVMAEFTSENARFLVRNERTRSLVEEVTRRFSQPNLADMAGWGDVLRHALRESLDVALDSRDLLHGDSAWLTAVLGGVARARDSATVPDEFLIGLFRGEGYPELVRGLLREGAERLGDEEADVLEPVVARVLERAAELAADDFGFEAFFQRNWNHLVAAALDGLRENGPILLEDDSALLLATLDAAVGAVAESLDTGARIGGPTLAAAVQSALAVVASDPELLEDAVDEDWLRSWIAGSAALLADGDLQGKLGRAALEDQLRLAFRVVGDSPEAFLSRPGAVTELVGGALRAMAAVDSLGLRPLADAAVAGSLRAIEENPDLIDEELAPTIGAVAGELALAVRERRLTRAHGQAIVEAVVDGMLANPDLFGTVDDPLARSILAAVLASVEQGEASWLAGADLVETVRGVLDAFAARGLALVTEVGAAAIEAELRTLLDEALERANEELGIRLDRSRVPAVIGVLIDLWLAGRLDPTGISKEDFAALFAHVAEALLPAAGLLVADTESGS